MPSASTPETRRTLSAFRGCFLGGAIGDALGAPIEFDDLTTIRRRFGPAGITGLEPAYGRRGAITDDTQMTLFTAEGLIRAHNRWLGRGIASVPAVVHGAYLRWLVTQGRPVERCEADDGWLIGVKGLHATRAPGNTCLGALESGRRGTPGEPLNDSKGCGGVMRIAPVGLVADEPFKVGGELAAITHGHPTGWLAAGYLAEVIGGLVRGADLPDAAREALRPLRLAPDHEETLAGVEQALALAQEGRPSASKVRSLGAGWVAEEALAVGLYAALVAEDFLHGVLLAVNHSGDSDSTGSIAGNLLGLLHGDEGIPAGWRAEVELAEVITTLADDFHRALAVPREGGEPYLPERYPGV